MNTLTRSGIRYAADIPNADYTEVIGWLKENFGEPDMKGRWFPLQFTFQFANKRDRDWFFLRWGT
jgi:hypothetical protein